MEPNRVAQTREAFGEYLDKVVANMRKEGVTDVNMSSHIGLFNINLLTSMVNLIDRPEEEHIAPEHRYAYDQCRQIARDVFKEKGFYLLEY